MLNWDDLRVFLQVARVRTLSAAAERLQVDQSTVGRRLTALEEAAGVRLFERSVRGYALSAAGESIVTGIEQIEAHAFSVEQKLRGQDGRSDGVVRVATSDSFASWFLIPRLAGLRAAHPGVVVELVTGNRPVDLGKREADISLRLTKPTQPQLVARKLGEAAWACYASGAYLAARGTPSLARRLQGHDVIGFEDELAGTIGAQWMKQHTGRARVVGSSNSLTCQAAAVVAGLGVCALPCVFGDREPSLQRVGSKVIGQHEIWLVVHPDVRVSARVRVVLDYLTRVVKQEAALLAGRSRRA